MGLRDRLKKLEHQTEEDLIEVRGPDGTVRRLHLEEIASQWQQGIEALEAEKATWSKEKLEAWDTPRRRAALEELEAEIRRRRREGRS